ncbi:DUF551 domain-containing protein [Burkholderia stagnalis]|uniref:DUF551 domain-containing protein n=1 Tax=Burkholderia stagnalis TaxID=1503054 RepID=UPI0018C53FC3|nr:DUF551 domain-containing protein [Burkholderia stagnalis]
METLVRFCPECGSVGEVPEGARDCCPDGSAARYVPQKFAETCRETFKLAIAPALHVAPKWTPTAEALPTKPGSYLVMLAEVNDWGLTSAYPIQVEFDAFTSKPREFTYSDGWHDNDAITEAVTHWMPLPCGPSGQGA